MDVQPKTALQEIENLLDSETLPAVSDGLGLDFPALRLAWWMETFIRAELRVFRDHWAARPQDERRDLRVRIGRIFLLQPLLQRLTPAGIRPPSGVQWELARGGSLLHLTGGPDDSSLAWIYYVLPHRRVWPSLLPQLDWSDTPGPERGAALEADLAFTARSGIDTVRERAATLRRIILDAEEGPRPEPSEPAERAAGPEPEGPAPAASPVKRRGRRRKSDGQLSLFEEP